MHLRTAKKSDIQQMLEIIRENFSDNDAKLAKKEILDMFSKSFNRPTYIVAVEKGRIVGLAGFIHSWFSYGLYEIFWVVVSPDFHKRGVGKKIIQHVVERIKKFKGRSQAYGIILSSASAGFFIKCGFQKISRSPKGKSFLMFMKIE